MAHGALSAYQAGASGSGILVGVVDSGIATANGEFAGRISSLSRDFAGNGSIEDAGGHGTAVTTILAGARDNNFVHGMAWGSTILTLRTDAPDSCISARDDDGCSHGDGAIREAIDYARTNGARVLNISLGGDEQTSSALLLAVSRATAAGVIIVVAAGNAGLSSPSTFASSIADAGNGLVIVAGSNESDNSFSSFSNGAAGQVQRYLTALGRRVLSQDNKGTHFLYSGTSFSAPQISGAIALIQQAFPNLAPRQIVDLLFATATDGGVAGDDAQFGQGILNLAKAFAPQGAVSLAGSGQAVSQFQSASLSPAMGDAMTSQSLNIVVLDRLGRAYGMDLASSAAGALPLRTFVPALRGQVQNLSGRVGALTVAMSLAPSRRPVPVMLTGDEAVKAQLLSSRLTARLGRHLTFAIGYGDGVGALRQSIAGRANAAFLVGKAPFDEMGFPARAVSAAAFAYRPSARIPLTLNVAAETGKAASAKDRSGYSSIRAGADARIGPIGLELGGGRLRENGTMLGARFLPGLGPRSATTLFADARLTLMPGGGWGLAAAGRRSWTRGADGALTSGARLVSESWALHAGKAGVVDASDTLSFRLSQPVRVRSGGFDLMLPVAYDYASLTATEAVRRFSLAPAGRERTVETAYGRPLGGGWLTANAFWRRQAGNLLAYPEEYAGALRYSLRF